MARVDLSLSHLAEHLGAEFVRETASGERWYRCFRSALHTNADQTPSLEINDEKGAFKCWGCGIEGKSAATMVMAAHPDMDAKAAGRWLHEHFGMGEAPPPRAQRGDGRPPRRPPLKSKPETPEEWEAGRARILSDEETRATWEARAIMPLWLDRAGAAVGEYGGEKTTAVAMWLFEEATGRWVKVGTMHRRVTATCSGWPWVREIKRDGEKKRVPKKSLCNEGGKLGLFIPQRIARTETIHVFEGMPDWFCGVGHNLAAIGLPNWLSSTRGAIAAAVKRFCEQAKRIVLCPQRDKEGQSQRGMRNVAALVGLERCTVLWPPEHTGKDFADAVAAGIDPFRFGKAASVESLGATSATGDMPLTERHVWVDDEQGALMLRQRNMLAVRVANFDVRVTGELIRQGIQPGDPPQSEIEVEIVPLSGALKGHPVRVGSLVPAVWLDQRLTLERIMAVYPSAQVTEVWPQAWANVRSRAQSLCPEDRRGRHVCSRTGWHDDRYVMPSITIGPGGNVIGSGETEARWVLEHDLMPPLGEPRAILEMVRALIDLSRMSFDEHANAVLMGIHLAAAFSSRLRRQMVARPSVFLESVAKTGKSWLARAHMLLWVPGVIIGDHAGPGELSLESSTPKAAHEAVAPLWDTVLLVDNWNTQALTRNRDEWIRFFHAMFDAATIRRLTSRIERRDTAATGACVIVTGEESPQDAGAESRFVRVLFNTSPWNDETVSTRVRAKAALDGEARCRRLQSAADTLLAVVPTCIQRLIRAHGSLAAVETRAGQLAGDWSQRFLDTAAGREARLVTAIGVGLSLLHEALDIAVRETNPEAPELFEIGSRFTALEESLASWYGQGMSNGMRYSEWRPDQQFLRALSAMALNDEIGVGNFNKHRPQLMTWRPTDNAYGKGGGTVSICWEACFDKAAQFLARTSRPLRAGSHTVKQLLRQRGVILAENVARQLVEEGRRANMTVLRDDVFEFLRGEVSTSDERQPELNLGEES